MMKLAGVFYLVGSGSGVWSVLRGRIRIRSNRNTAIDRAIFPPLDCWIFVVASSPSRPRPLLQPFSPILFSNKVNTRSSVLEFLEKRWRRGVISLSDRMH